MCLTIEPQFKMNTQRRRCWKVLELDFNNRLFSPWYWHEYKPGVVKSNRDTTNINPTERRDAKINFGIHLYWSRYAASMNLGINEVVVPVTCYKRNFVARGDKDDAVFTRVSLSKADYEATTKAKRSTV